MVMILHGCFSLTFRPPWFGFDDSRLDALRGRLQQDWLGNGDILKQGDEYFGGDDYRCTCFVSVGYDEPFYF